MSTFTITKVNALPGVLAANTLYAIPSATADLFDLYLSDKTGTSAKHISGQAETLNSVVVFGDVAPALPCKSPLWWNTSSGTMYIQYNDGASTNWVEAIPSIPVPDFAGTGVAGTMARSDHDHDATYAKIGINEW